MTTEKEQAIVALYKAGRYNSDICAEYGIPKNELAECAFMHMQKLSN